MPELAVSDTGPVLHLVEVDLVEQLAMFDRVAVSQHVKAELRRRGALRAAAEALGDRLRVEQVKSDEIAAQRSAFSALNLHLADLSTAALAARLRPTVVLTDDLALRRGLEGEGFTVAGSVGVLVRALTSGRIDRAQLDKSLDRLFDGSSLHTSKAFQTRVRELLGQPEERSETA